MDQKLSVSQIHVSKGILRHDKVSKALGRLVARVQLFGCRLQWHAARLEAGLCGRFGRCFFSYHNLLLVDFRGEPPLHVLSRSLLSVLQVRLAPSEAESALGSLLLVQLRPHVLDAAELGALLEHQLGDVQGLVLGLLRTQLPGVVRCGHR